MPCATLMLYHARPLWGIAVFQCIVESRTSRKDNWVVLNRGDSVDRYTIHSR